MHPKEHNHLSTVLDGCLKLAGLPPCSTPLVFFLAVLDILGVKHPMMGKAAHLLNALLSRLVSAMVVKTCSAIVIVAAEVLL